MKDFEDTFYDNDGWNLNELADMGLMDVLSDASGIEYEIANCVRGTYAVSGDTVEDLKGDLLELAERLKEIAEQL
jgi:hypothetical protein